MIKGVSRRHRRPADLIIRDPVDISFRPLSFSTQFQTTSYTMEALRLRKKYPEVSQDEMFDLISRFKSVASAI